MKNIILFSTVLILSLSQSSNGLQCMSTECRKCSDISKIDYETECEFQNTIPLSQWGVTEPLTLNPEFSCIEVITTNSTDNTKNVMRGCIIKQEDVCKTMEGNVKNDKIECNVCETNYCNNAQIATISSTLVTFFIFTCIKSMM